MSEVIVFLVLGVSAIIAILIFLYKLFGERLRRAKFGVSLQEGVFGEFEIDTPVVKVTSKSEPIIPQQPPKVKPPRNPILTPKLEQSEPEFMSDEYIVDIATRLQMEAEEGDLVRFIDHTEAEM